MESHTLWSSVYCSSQSACFQGSSMVWLFSEHRCFLTLNNDTPLYSWITSCLSPINGHGCFHLLKSVKSAADNCMNDSLKPLSQLCGSCKIYPDVELLYLIVILCLSISGIPRLFQGGCTILYSNHRTLVYFSTSLQTLRYLFICPFLIGPLIFFWRSAVLCVRSDS